MRTFRRARPNQTAPQNNNNIVDLTNSGSVHDRTSFRELNGPQSMQTSNTTNTSTTTTTTTTTTGNTSSSNVRSTSNSSMSSSNYCGKIAINSVTTSNTSQSAKSDNSKSSIAGKSISSGYTGPTLSNASKSSANVVKERLDYEKIMLENSTVSESSKNGKKGSTSSTQHTISSSFSQTNSMERFCSRMLQWKLFDDLRSKEREKEFSTLPNRYRSLDEYIQAWEELTLEEIRCSVISNLSENTRSPDCIGAFQLKSIDDMNSNLSTVKLECGIVPSREIAALPMRAGGESNDKKSNFISMDLLLLTNTPLSLPVSWNSFTKANVSTWFLGIVLDSSNDKAHVKVAKSEWRRFLEKLRLAKMQGNGPSSTPTQSSHRFYYIKLDSLVSSFREYFALFEIENSPYLLNDILNNQPAERPSDTPAVFQDIPTSYSKIIEANFNSSQYNAIVAATNNNHGFTLIQGPPGTGKTTTILAILNSIHVREYNLYYEMTIEQITSQRGIGCRGNTTSMLELISELGGIKPHILVTAPSNVAVDNIIQRIVQNGFTDAENKRYFPKIVRLGIGQGESVRSVSLETLVSEELQYYPNSNARQTVVDNLFKDMQVILQQVLKLQQYLVNLRTAFFLHELPHGWEVCINEETGMPFWVDHINKSTCQVPPPVEKD